MLGRLYNMLQTPVVLFNFNRPEQTLRALEQLTRLNCSKVYLVCDGPREGNLDDQDRVESVRNHLKNWQSSGDKVFFLAERNLGLRERFFSALDSVFADEDAAIILEDDCVIDDSFFDFAEAALVQYPNSEGVGIVAAHNPMPSQFRQSVQFDTYPRIWGWASHGDLWRRFRASPLPNYSDKRFRGKVLRTLGSRTMRLMFAPMMTHSFSSRTWDVDFASFCISQGLLNISPPTNLCSNSGLEGNGTNSQDWSSLELPKVRTLLNPVRWRKKRKPSFLSNACVDIRRLSRWARASSRSPADALRKIRSLFELG